MSYLTDPREFLNDYVFIKFAGLAAPTLIPWIEVASGVYVHEESTVDELVFLTNKAARRKGDEPDEVVTEESAIDVAPTKTHIKKADLIAYLNNTLREPANPTVVDYGPVEDIRMQPAGRDMTKEVFAFLANYGAI